MGTNILVGKMREYRPFCTANGGVTQMQSRICLVHNAMAFANQWGSVHMREWNWHISCETSIVFVLKPKYSEKFYLFFEHYWNNASPYVLIRSKKTLKQRLENDCIGGCGNGCSWINHILLNYNSTMRSFKFHRKHCWSIFCLETSRIPVTHWTCYI